MDTVKSFAKSTLSSYTSLSALDIVGASRMIANTENMALRNIERGGVWYVSNELVSFVMGEENQFESFQLPVLVNDTLFYAIVSGAIEIGGQGIVGMISDRVQQFMPFISNPDVVATAVVINSLHEIEKRFQIPNEIRHLGSRLGIV